MQRFCIDESNLSNGLLLDPCSYQKKPYSFSPEVHSEPCEISNIQRFAKIVINQDVRQVPEYALVPFKIT